MNKKLLILAAVLVPAAFVFGTIQELVDGDHIGVKSTDKLGFYGATPVVRPANSVTAFGALQTLGLIATGGSDTTTTTANNPIQHVTIPLSAAQINGMAAAPVQLVAAQGAGKSIVVDRVGFRITRTATAFASGGAVIIQYNNTATGAGTQACDSTIASTVITGSALTTDTMRNGAVISDSTSTVTENVGLFISNQTGAFTTGTGTATVDVWYYVY